MSTVVSNALKAAAGVGKSKTVLDIGSMAIPPKSTVFSMIQPTGVFHIGNYLGAVKSWVDIQNDVLTTDWTDNGRSQYETNEPKLIFGVADLHALTVPKDPKMLKFTRRQAVASMLATGLDPELCIIFQQSQVPEHTQLYWLLSTVTGMGYLNRMTQWKSKSNLDDNATLLSVSEESVKALSSLHLGLFAYPCLQAADILLYKSNLVPVGDDQTQHLELTRHITAAFNKAYPRVAADDDDPRLTYKKEIFPEPRTILAPFKKILSLRDPSKKMSKSDPDPASCIYIPDTPEQIKKAIRRAITDSNQEITYDPVNRPGIANLLSIASGILQKSPEQVLDLIKPKDHKELKDNVAEIVIEGLKPVRREYQALMEDLEYIDQVSKSGALRAREIASQTMKDVNNAVGL